MIVKIRLKRSWRISRREGDVVFGIFFTPQTQVHVQQRKKKET